MAYQFGAVLLLAYWTILVAELIGDKSLYTVASLSMRFMGRQVLAGIGVAFGLKMLIAVLLGNTLAHLPGKWLALLTKAGIGMTVGLKLRGYLSGLLLGLTFLFQLLE